MIIKSIGGFIGSALNRKKRMDSWRRRNCNNHTSVGNEFCYDNVSVGNATYGTLEVLLHNDDYHLRIGNYCSIAPDVIFVPASEHRMNQISTFPFQNKIINSEIREAFSKGDIVIEDDVWIGSRAIILSGVHIGQGAVVAAGAVVSCNVLPYSIVGGVPAKEIKKRFDQEIIDFLCTLDYSRLTEDLIRLHIADLYTDITAMDLVEIEKTFSWFPKR